MISKDNIKYYILIAFISIILYKAIDSPRQILDSINGLMSFFSPFLIGILLTLLLNPMIMFLERKFKSHRLINIFISYILITFVLSVGFKLLIPAIIDTLNTLINEIPNLINMLNIFLNKHLSQSQVLESVIPHLQNNLNSILTRLLDLFSKVSSDLFIYIFSITSLLFDIIMVLESVIPHLQNNLNSILTRLLDLFSKVSSDLFIYIFSITSLLFDIIMGIILSIYMLYDKEKIGLGCKKILYACFPINKANNIIEFFKVSHNIFYHYIIGKLIDSLIIGCLAFIGFQFILKINNALFLSFIIFLTNIIPYFGPFIGAVFPIVMTLVYSPIKSLWVALFLLILQQLDGNLIGPKIMGDQVGLSPLWIISAVLIGGSLFGIIGVFLSVPIAAIIKFSIDKYVQNKIHIRIQR